jgi:GNAT superfamily N-acetyltransferase
MTLKLETDVNSDELYRFLKATERRTMGRFFLDKKLPQEKAFEAIAGELGKFSQKPGIVKTALLKENNLSGIGIVDESSWDTDILGLKYGKMKLLCFHNEATIENRGYLLSAMVNKLTEKDFKLVVIRVPMDDTTTVNALERKGAVTTDVLLTFNHDLRQLNPSQARIRGVAVAEARPDDEEDIVRIGQNVFKIDHFHADPRLPSDRCDELYAKWTKNCLNGLSDKVLVAKKGPDVAGFITCKVESLVPEYKYGIIDLVGVADESQRTGVGTLLVDEALKWFSGKVASVYVGTQTGNIAALRLYEKCAFKAIYSEVTLHLWLP